MTTSAHFSLPMYDVFSVAEEHIAVQLDDCNGIGSGSLSGSGSGFGFGSSSGYLNNNTSGLLHKAKFLLKASAAPIQVDLPPQTTASCLTATSGTGFSALPYLNYFTALVDATAKIVALPLIDSLTVSTTSTLSPDLSVFESCTPR